MYFTNFCSYKKVQDLYIKRSCRNNNKLIQSKWLAQKYFNKNCWFVLVFILEDPFLWFSIFVVYFSLALERTHRIKMQMLREIQKLPQPQASRLGFHQIEPSIPMLLNMWWQRWRKKRLRKLKHNHRWKCRTCEIPEIKGSILRILMTQ